MSDDLSRLLASGGAVDVGGLFDRPAWQQHAACRGKPIEWFFPEVGGSTEQAKAVCAGCSVAAECHAQAVEGSELGIWAGKAAGARQKLRNAA